MPVERNSRNEDKLYDGVHERALVDGGNFGSLPGHLNLPVPGRFGRIVEVINDFQRLFIFAALDNAFHPPWEIGNIFYIHRCRQARVDSLLN